MPKKHKAHSRHDAQADIKQPLQGFPPIACDDARILILGSMPSVESLRVAQYYAHPRNAFWRIIAALFDHEPFADYVAKTALLMSRGIALWDVVHACTRDGSLDADIDEASIVVNDFTGFFARYPKITTVFFNGAKAEHAFRRYVLPTLTHAETLTFYRLPSTSPAHAAKSLAVKLSEWRRILDHL